jgi:hypothetical protein
MELIWFNKNKTGAEQGYLIYNDVMYNPAGGAFRFGARLQFFETNGFNSRLYAFENDFTSGYAVHAVYQKGLRYYLNAEIDFSDVKTTHNKVLARPVKAYFRWAHTVNETEAGTGFQGGDGQEFKIQLIFSKL